MPSCFTASLEGCRRLGAMAVIIVAKAGFGVTALFDVDERLMRRGTVLTEASAGYIAVVTRVYSYKEVP